MEARLVFILSVFTLGLWTHVTPAVTSSEGEGREARDKTDSSADVPSLYKLEQYLYDIRSKLDRVRELYGGEGRDPTSSEEDQVEYRVVPNTKRKAPTGFYGVRGRRAQQVMTSPDADDDVREASDLLQLMEFYRALHGTRPQTGELMSAEVKRQPPRGFHAVRGRRSAPRGAN